MLTAPESVLLARSTFDSGVAGWTAIGNTGQPVHDAAGGNLTLLGNTSASPRASSRRASTCAPWRRPNGRLAFDLRRSTDVNALLGGFNAAILKSGGQSLLFAAAMPARPEPAAMSSTRLPATIPAWSSRWRASACLPAQAKAQNGGGRGAGIGPAPEDQHGGA